MCRLNLKVWIKSKLGDTVKLDSKVLILMGVFHWSRPVGNYALFEGGAARFTQSVRVCCSFLAGLSR